MHDGKEGKRRLIKAYGAVRVVVSLFCNILKTPDANNVRKLLLLLLALLIEAFQKHMPLGRAHQHVLIVREWV